METTIYYLHGDGSVSSRTLTVGLGQQPPPPPPGAVEISPSSYETALAGIAAQVEARRAQVAADELQRHTTALAALAAAGIPEAAGRHIMNLPADLELPGLPDALAQLGVSIEGD